MAYEEDIRQVVRMEEDYTTESHNLGKRTYRAGGIYQVCDTMLKELLADGKAVKLDPKTAPRPTAIEREQVAIIPKVSNWFTANGLDTHHLTEGKKQRVPSNLAQFLIINGYAQAA